MNSVVKKVDKTVASTGDDILAKPSRWSFDGSVADKFDDHVAKSVPLYETGHDLTVKLSDFFVNQGSAVYELGASTGTLLRKLADQHSDRKNARFIGLEVSADMVNHAKKRHSNTPNIFFQTSRAETFKFEKSDFITSHYTIQFIPPKFRQQLFNNVYEALEWGGGFVLFEKVRANDARFQDMFTTLYSEYKIDNGYTFDEILSKTLSLKGIMEPFSSDENVSYMQRAGFKDIISIQKYLCFEGWLAIK